MNWGKWIIVAFTLFAVFIGTLVFICVRQDVSLVTKDYYKEELAYEKQITRLQNTAALSQKPVIRNVQQGLAIEFEQLSKIEKGELILFCPANPGNDRRFSINASPATIHFVPVADVQPGMYHAKFSWTMDGKEFYLDKPIVL